MGYATSGPGAEPLESVSEESIRMTREQVVVRIMELNATATAEFLGGFAEAALRDYLRHLESAQVPRGARARWARPEGVPGILSRAAGP